MCRTTAEEFRLFTGLVEKLIPVTLLQPIQGGIRVGVDASDWSGELTIGESIALNGCCLTVVAIGEHGVEFEAGEETLSKTTLGSLKPGHLVNAERALRAGDRMGGHWVSGHVDCVAKVVSRNDDGDWTTLWFEVPAKFSSHLVNKGSVTVDGVSLTVVEVQSNQFSVALIPHTLSVTTLGLRQPGDPVNIETDVLAKYVERQLEAWRTT